VHDPESVADERVRQCGEFPGEGVADRIVRRRLGRLNLTF
jgi:hypothetical protein